MRIRLHRHTQSLRQSLRRARRAQGAELMLDCFDELSLIAEHRVNVEGQLAATH